MNGRQVNEWAVYLAPPLLIGGGGITGIYLAQHYDYDEVIGLAVGLMVGSVASGVYMKVQVSSETYREALRSAERNQPV